MNKIRLIFVILFLILMNNCSKDEKEISLIKESKQDLEMVTAYREAYKAVEEGDPYFAAQKFLEAELLFPQSEWAPKSALMAAYSYYTQDYYADTIAELERFLRVYPLSKNLDYSILNRFSTPKCYILLENRPQEKSNSVIKILKEIFGTPCVPLVPL